MYTQQNRRSFIGAIGITLACSFALASAAIGADKAKIKIALVDADGKCVKESLTGKLELDRKYVKGDEHYAETLLFVPKEKVDFPIPLWPVGKPAAKPAKLPKK